MPTPFLETFAVAVVTRLVDADLVVLRGPPDAVAAFLAEDLARDVPGRSLLSTLATALIRCPDVDELFAEDEDLKHIVETLGVVRG